MFVRKRGKEVTIQLFIEKKGIVEVRIEGKEEKVCPVNVLSKERGERKQEGKGGILCA